MLSELGHGEFTATRPGSATLYFLNLSPRAHVLMEDCVDEAFFEGAESLAFLCCYAIITIPNGEGEGRASNDFHLPETPAVPEAADLVQGIFNVPRCDNAPRNDSAELGPYELKLLLLGP